MKKQLSEEEKTDLLTRINEMIVWCDRIKPPHGKAVRDELREGALLLLEQLESEAPLDSGLLLTKEFMETFLWALRVAEEQLPPGMAAQ